MVVGNSSLVNYPESVGFCTILQYSTRLAERRKKVQQGNCRNKWISRDHSAIIFELVLKKYKEKDFVQQR